MSRLPRGGGCGGGCSGGQAPPTQAGSSTGLPRGIPRAQGGIPRSSGYGRPPPTSGRPPQPSGMQPPRSGIQPPRSGIQPPGSGMQPPRSGIQPPRSGLQPPSSGGPPQTSGIQAPRSGLQQPRSGMQPPGRPSSGPPPGRRQMAPPQAQSTMIAPSAPPGKGGKGVPGKGPGKAKGKREGPPKEYVLPPLSTFKGGKEVETELDKLRNKTKLRNAPEGEDSKAIREILRNMRDQEITVHEFIGVLSPYTGDNGTVLRNVLACELSSFRTMARNVYDTMTQDVSDVLINEHVQLKEASKERHAQYTDKMMRAIDEIYEYVPDFNFEKYYTDPEYLEKLFPLAKEEIVDEETEAIQMRQEAYHRLMWLRSEGDRLGEENRRLAERLKELKRRQKDQMMRASDIEKTNEEKRKQLEKTQEALEEQLDVMNTSIEKSIVEQEKMIREQEDVLPPRLKKEKKKMPKRRGPAGKPVENWNVKAAAEIEESATTEALVAEVSKVSMASTVSATKGVLPKASTGAIPKTKKGAPTKKKFSKFSRTKIPQDQDPFHYSPIKTPPPRGAASMTGGPPSPFHYSPPRSPPGGYGQQQQRTPYMEEARGRTPHMEAPYMEEARGRTPHMEEARGRTPQMETTRVQATATTRDQVPPGENRQLPPPRRAQAPRDTWGGYY